MKNGFSCTNLFLKIIIITVGFSCSTSYAAQECFFTIPRTYTMQTATIGTLNPLPAGQSGWLTTRQRFTGVSAATTCNLGPDGFSLNGWADISPATSISFSNATTSYNAGLFETNVPGIYYAIEIAANGGTDSSGYIPASTNLTKLYKNSETSPLDGRAHYFYVALYQSSAYRPNGVTKITPKTTGTIGHFVYGDNSDGDDNIGVAVSSSSFTADLRLPTCKASLGSENASGNTVNLGDYTTSDLQKGTTSIIPFAVNLANCVNTVQANFKLTANNYDSSTGYLKNSGTSMGVGVKITDTNNKQLKADGSNTLSSSVNGNNSATIHLNAQLLKLSDNIQTGKFSAPGILQIDYQ